MHDFSLRIGNNLDGKDIKFILKHSFGFSSKLITALKAGDGIMLNGKKEFVIKRVRCGDFLQINLPQKPSLNILPNNIPIDILYEDDDLLAVNKPANMPTHPSIGHFEGTLANAVMYYFRDIPFTFRAVTRLDRDTTGVTVIAKNAPAANIMSRLIQQNILIKEYTAVCAGTPSSLAGRIDAPIKRAKEGIIKRCISESGKPAISDYEVIEFQNGLSLIRLFPRTGRTHQLRLHLSHIGTPIYADFMYGTEVSGERTRLHCSKISFPHPFSKEKIVISAPIPDDMLLKNIEI